MRKDIKIVCIILIGFCFFAGIVNAEYSGASFLKMGVGARATAMGCAYTGIASDPSAIYWNVSGLYQIHRKTLSLSHTWWTLDMHQDFLSFINPTSIGIFGVSLLYFSAGEMEKRGDNREKLSSGFNAYDMAFSISYAKSLSSKIAAGMNLKFISQQIEEESSMGGAVDIGALYHFYLKRNLVQIGIALQNLGPKLKFIDKEYNLPISIKSGIGFVFNNLIFAFDVKRNLIEKSTEVSFGSEYSVLGMFSLRMGYLVPVSESREIVLFSNKNVPQGLSTGIGLKVQDFQIDYCFIPDFDISGTHKIDVGYKF